MEIYNKLVRDRIPEIITNKGQKPTVRVLDDDEYIKELNIKLQEEVNEYLTDKNVEELADIVEVIYGILRYKEISIQEFEKIRNDKNEKRGSFFDKIYLESVE